MSRQSLFRSQPNTCRIMPTKADASCAFHAALGFLRAGTCQYEVDEVDLKRKQVAGFIRCSQSTPAFDFVKQAIISLVMDNRRELGVQFQRLCMAYEEALLLDEGIRESKKSYLTSELKKQPQIVEYIERHAPHLLQKDLYTQYYHCENKNDDLKKLILASNSPNLIEAYHQSKNTDIMNWDTLLNNNPALLNEYASFFEQSTLFVLPCEVAIIAYAFEISIDFYNTDASPECFNPGCKNRVSIYFDGVNHYARMMHFDISSSQKVDVMGDDTAQVKNQDRVLSAIKKVTFQVPPKPTSVESMPTTQYPGFFDGIKRFAIDNKNTLLTAAVVAVYVGASYFKKSTRNGR